MRIKKLGIREIRAAAPIIPEESLRPGLIYVGIIDEGTIAGVIVLDASYVEGALDLEWIYVREQFRGRGYGKLMIDSIGEALGIDEYILTATYMDNPLLDYILLEDDFDVRIKSAQNYRCPIENFEKFAQKGADDGKYEGVKLLTEITAEELEELYKSETYKDFAELIQTYMRVCEHDKSFALVEKGRIEALLFGGFEDDFDTYNIEFVWSSKENHVYMIKLFSGALARVKDSSMKPKVVTFTAVNEATEKLGRYICSEGPNEESRITVATKIV